MKELEKQKGGWIEVNAPPWKCPPLTLTLQSALSRALGELKIRRIYLPKKGGGGEENEVEIARERHGKATGRCPHCGARVRVELTTASGDQITVSGRVNPFDGGEAPRVFTGYDLGIGGAEIDTKVIFSPPTGGWERCTTCDVFRHPGKYAPR